MSAIQRRKNPCPGLKVELDQGSWVESRWCLLESTVILWHYHMTITNAGIEYSNSCTLLVMVTDTVANSMKLKEGIEEQKVQAYAQITNMMCNTCMTALLITLTLSKYVIYFDKNHVSIGVYQGYDFPVWSVILFLFHFFGRVVNMGRFCISSDSWQRWMWRCWNTIVVPQAWNHSSRTSKQARACLHIEHTWSDLCRHVEFMALQIVSSLVMILYLLHFLLCWVGGVQCNAMQCNATQFLFLSEIRSIWSSLTSRFFNHLNSDHFCT